jgi:zinc protease
MFFKANKDIPSQEKYLDRIHELGMRFNGTTSVERVNYFFTLGSQDVREGLLFMNSAIRYPLFLAEEMKKEDPVVDGEFQRQESNPYFALFDRFNHRFWGDLYSRRNPIGDHQVILTCTPEKMQVIKNKYYYPNNSLLIVAGAIRNEEILSLVKSIFGDWKPSGFDPFQKWPIPEAPPLNPSDSLSFVVTNENARVPLLQIGWRGPDTRTDYTSTLAADLFSTILGEKSSRFQRELVDSGYALSANISYFTEKYVGPITLQMVPNPGKFKNAFQALERQLEAFDSDDYFTDEQMNTAKAQLAHTEKYAAEVTSNHTHDLSFWWCSASLDQYFDYPQAIQKLTREDIRRYIRQYIQGKPCVKGLLLNPGMQKNWNVSSLDRLFQ